jgi:hypothetical protein
VAATAPASTFSKPYQLAAEVRAKRSADWIVTETRRTAEATFAYMHRFASPEHAEAWVAEQQA